MLNHMWPIILSLILSANSNSPVQTKELRHRSHKDGNLAKLVKPRCKDMVCSLICPISVVFRPGSDTGHPENQQSTSMPTTSQRSSTASASKTTKAKSRHVPIIANPGMAYSNYIKHYISKRKNKIAKYQKHVIIRRFRIRYKNVGKAYSYRQLLPNGCKVICEKDQVPSSPTNGQEHGQSNESGSEEDVIQEGEDLPIEATVSPGENKGKQISPVNLAEIDDFGTDIWSPRDPINAYDSSDTL